MWRRLILPTVALLGICSTSGVLDAQNAALRPLADALGMSVGVGVDGAGLDDDDHRSLVAANANMLASRNQLSMASLQPEPGVFDFTRADAVVDFAAANDMTVRGTDLIGPAVPEWVRAGTWEPDALADVLRGHVATVIGHYRERNPGVITEWGVVTEATMPDGSLRPTIWQQVIGDRYIDLAFAAARDADPDAQLFLDDFFDDIAVTQDAVASGVELLPGADAERSSCAQVPKCVGAQARVTDLLDRGVPIDGIGLQTTLYSPDPFDVGGFSAWIEDLELEWAVTEFAVPVPTTETADPASLEFQAAVYADVLAACVDSDRCNTFVALGMSDRFSPIADASGGAFGAPLVFDTTDEPKPAFRAVLDVLTQRQPAPSTTTIPDTIADRITDDDGSDATVAPLGTGPPGVDAETTAGDGANDARSFGTVGMLLAGAAAVISVLVVLVVLRRRS